MRNEWYAIRVRSNFEQTTATFLENSGYDVLNAKYREWRQWSDRSKQVEVPLFGGYVFCHMNIDNRLPVLKAPGVVNIVAFGKMFVPVPESEIEAVRTIVSSPVFARPCPYLNVGDRVRVERGPLSGLEGVLQEFKTEYRLIVSVHLLQRSISAEVTADCIKPVNPTFRIPSLRSLHAAPAAC